MAKKIDKKKIKTPPVKKPVKKASSGKKKAPSKPVKKVSGKKSKASKPVKKPVQKKPDSLKSKPATKARPAKKIDSKATVKPVKAEKKKITSKPAQQVMEQKPIGSPTKLSMAFEEKELQPAFVKPRITRSKSGNLLFQLEYTIRSSPGILYEFLTTPSGMAQWFADKVDITDHHCTFEWEGVEDHATIIDSIPDEYIRYRWDNSDEDEYFEFRISKNEITGDTILTITDFASEADIKDQKMLWDSQIKLLTQQIGG